MILDYNSKSMKVLFYVISYLAVISLPEVAHDTVDVLVSISIL